MIVFTQFANQVVIMQNLQIEQSEQKGTIDIHKNFLV